MQLLAAHKELLGEDAATEGRNFKYVSTRDSVKEKLQCNIVTTLCLDIFSWQEKEFLGSIIAFPSSSQKSHSVHH